MTFALGALARMSASSVSRLPGSVVTAYCSALATALSQELVDPSTQVSMIETKPTSSPPAVRLTSVVAGLREDSWLLITSAVVALEQAANVNEATGLAAAHSFG